MTHNVKVYRPQGGDKLVVSSGGEIEVKPGGEISLGGVGIAAKLSKLTGFAVATKTGATGQKDCLTNGLTLITGGTGIADMALAAPSPGEVAIIRLVSLTSGSVVVTAAEGVTLDGTNNTATFDAAEETLILVYANENTWAVALNAGSITLSEVAGD